MEFGYIDVSDIVQYLYCPRKVYFHRVAGITLTRPKMEVGREFFMTELKILCATDLIYCPATFTLRAKGME